jgi:hypothetical protein
MTSRNEKAPTLLCMFGYGLSPPRVRWIVGHRIAEKIDI